MANAKIDAKLIRKIPFRDNTDAVTIALDQLTDEKAWPLVLRGHEFDAERKAYIKAVDDALAQDQEGDLTSDTIAKVRGAVAALAKRVAEVIPSGPAARPSRGDQLRPGPRRLLEDAREGQCRC